MPWLDRRKACGSLTLHFPWGPALAFLHFSYFVNAEDEIFPSSVCQVEVLLYLLLITSALYTHLSSFSLPRLHLQRERRDWCCEHATVVSIYQDQTSAGISLTPKGLLGCPLSPFLILIPPFLPPLLPHPLPPLPPPSPFNIEAGDEKWCAFVYLPPMQMRPQQD